MHVAAAVIGLSALLASSATAFTIVKLVGAAYLIVIGIRRLLARHEDAVEPEAEPAPGSPREAVPPGRGRQRAQPEDGAVLPRLPPAVRRPGRGAAGEQVAIFGFTFVVLAVLSDSAYALAAAALAGKLRASERARRIRR